MASITVKNGEAKTVTFTVTRDSAAIDLTLADLSFVVKSSYDDTTYKIQKVTADFNKAQATLGIVSCVLTAANLAYANIVNGTYLSELRATITATDIDISANIDFIVERSLF